MYEMPKCKCGEELEFDNDTGFWCDGDVATMSSFGHCPKCGKNIDGLTIILYLIGMS